MTDTVSTSVDQLARIEKLRQRGNQASGPGSRADKVRPDSSPGGIRRPAKRRHAAFGSRVVAAALGVSAMFGIVAAMGFDAAQVQTQVAMPPVSVEAPRRIVVIHHNTTAPGDGQDVATVSASTPIALTAQPVVRVVQAPQSAAPVARTNGSR
jgi:hypothetical protein